ncbi:vacuolar protein-sorting-associated protein 36 [Drosophila teissieri]|uniref:vacuolar protein-sorting-associated protein 36 n=1 Tax=Drosophila teissieri TaxID=7243 RepID=UPI001CBA26DD|nr:vacuolar protein-sorting-associated protein 36 [Drosophila teissieri]
MDAKRGNASGARQGGGGYHASKTSVASRHASGGVAAAVGHKQASQVSLTPSQSRNTNANDNPRKSPLDALSRSGPVRNQNPFQRRSGLQDVDDAYLASNAFARPARVRHSGLDRDNMPQAAVGGAPGGQQPSAPIPAQQQQQQQQQQQYQQMPPVDAVPQQQMPPPAAVPSQQQLQQQYVQQPAAGQPTRMEPPPSGRAHVHQQQMPHQQQMQQQHQQQLPPQTGYEQQQQQVNQPDAQMQNKYANQQSHQLQPQHQSPLNGYPSQPPKAPQASMPTTGGAAAAAPGATGGNNAPRENAGGSAAPADAEMCTTCPNCQTTIYLVRSPELGHGDAGLPVQ